MVTDFEVPWEKLDKVATLKEQASKYAALV